MVCVAATHPRNGRGFTPWSSVHLQGLTPLQPAGLILLLQRLLAWPVLETGRRKGCPARHAGTRDDRIGLSGHHRPVCGLACSPRVRTESRQSYLSIIFGFLICRASPTKTKGPGPGCQGRTCAAVAGVAGTGRFGVGRRATRRTGARPEETGRELVVMATSSITWWGRWRGGSSRSAHTHSRLYAGRVRCVRSKAVPGVGLPKKARLAGDLRSQSALSPCWPCHGWWRRWRSRRGHTKASRHCSRSDHRPFIRSQPSCQTVPRFSQTVLSLVLHTVRSACALAWVIATRSAIA